MIRHINAAESDPKERRNVAELMRQVEEVRRAGHCFIPNMPMEGAGTVSMLLPWDMYGRPLAIGAGGYVGRIQPNMPEIVVHHAGRDRPPRQAPPLMGGRRGAGQGAATCCRVGCVLSPTSICSKNLEIV